MRLTLFSPQLTCATCSGKDFVDFTELEVVGGPPNTAPHGTLDASVRSVAVGAPVTFTARFTDDDSAITGYDWDFDGNGTVDRSTAGPTTSFAYSAAGTCTAKVMAKDFRGGAGTATSPSIAVTGPAGGGGGGQPRAAKAAASPGGGGGGQPRAAEAAASPGRRRRGAGDAPDAQRPGQRLERALQLHADLRDVLPGHGDGDGLARARAQAAPQPPHRRQPEPDVHR